MRLYLYGALALTLMFSHWWVWNHRGQVEELKRLQVVNEFREKEAQWLIKLNESVKTREVIYRDRIKIIESASGVCLDDPIPSPLVDSLRNDTSN